MLDYDKNLCCGFRGIYVVLILIYFVDENYLSVMPLVMKIFYLDSVSK